MVFAKLRKGHEKNLIASVKEEKLELKMDFLLFIFSLFIYDTSLTSNCKKVRTSKLIYKLINQLASQIHLHFTYFFSRSVTL